jgi:hypothetical protein
MPKFKIGDKVVPHSKTATGYRNDLTSCSKWRKAREIGQPFLYVIEITFNHFAEAEDELIYALSQSNDITSGGNYYREEDFELYIEYGRNTPLYEIQTKAGEYNAI